MEGNEATAMRRRILAAAVANGDGHIPSALSIADILFVLHRDIMDRQARDRLILSKGHASLALYAILEERGDIASMKGLPGHPEIGTPGVECSTGSLGHGLPMAAGLAYALKLRDSPAHVFCVVGDTEMEEGACWETLHLAARRGLGNLMVIVDNNGNSPNRIDGEPFETSLAQKFQAFGWLTSNVDGHDHEDLETMLLPLHADQPHAVIAQTVKGYGIPAMAADPQAWHRRIPNAAELSQMLAEIH